MIGQIAIYFIVANFKQHIFPLISTTRKVFTVLLSIAVFGHHVNLWQWASIVLVFGGLAYELKEELNAKREKAKEHGDSSEQTTLTNEKNKKKNHKKRKWYFVDMDIAIFLSIQSIQKREYIKLFYWNVFLAYQFSFS